MDIAEAKNKIIDLTAELIKNEAEYKELNKIYMEHRIKMNLCLNRKRELSKEIKKLEAIMETENMFELVENIEGFDTLLKSELVTISNGMNKTDYRKHGNYPRWIDLERLVKEVIAFKKLYPGWILDYIEQNGAYDTLPPETYYKYTYKTPQGHCMYFDGFTPIII
jgi:hypothetical protein